MPCGREDSPAFMVSTTILKIVKDKYAGERKGRAERKQNNNMRRFVKNYMAIFPICLDSLS